MNDPSTPQGNPYSSPRAVSTVSPPGVLTHQFKQRNLRRLTTLSLIIYCCTPVMGLLGWRTLANSTDGLNALTTPLLGDETPLWLGVFPLSVLIVLAVTLITHWINQRGYRWLAGQLATRLGEDGVDPHANGGHYVQLSPADRPSFYDQHSEWDTGYLFLFRDRMTYIGDQTRFSLRRESIIGEIIGPGGLQWPHPYQVYVDWRDPITNRIRTFSIWNGVRESIFLTAAEAQEFQQRLSEWRAAGIGGMDPTWADLGPPRLDNVEGNSQWKQLGYPSFVAATCVVAFLSWLVAAITCSVLGHPWNSTLPLAAAAVPTIALVFQHFPLMYLRDTSYSLSGGTSEPG